MTCCLSKHRSQEHTHDKRLRYSHRNMRYCSTCILMKSVYRLAEYYQNTGAFQEHIRYSNRCNNLYYNLSYSTCTLRSLIYIRIPSIQCTCVFQGYIRYSNRLNIRRYKQSQSIFLWLYKPSDLNPNRQFDPSCNSSIRYDNSRIPYRNSHWHNNEHSTIGNHYWPRDRVVRNCCYIVLRWERMRCSNHCNSR